MDGVRRNGVRGAQNSAGFSLIELLVMIAVVVVLAAVIFPALVRAKERARAIKCLSNVKQWTYALHTYMDDNEEYFPYEGNTTDPIDAGLNIEGWFNTVTLQLLQPGLKDLYASGSI